MNNYIPVSVGKSKDCLFSYEIYSDGIYLYKKLAGGGHCRIKVDGIPNVEKGTEEISLLSRKIPFNAFLKIVEFFKYVCDIRKDKLESYVIIGYNKELDKYCLYVPEQVVTVASVKYDLSTFYKEYPGYSIVMDNHVHPFSNSEPNWSNVDNANDINDRFSGVISDIYSVIPKYKFRFGSNGKYFNYDINDLFEDTKEALDLDFEESIKKIKSPSNINNIHKDFSISDHTNKLRERSFFDTYIKKKSSDINFTIGELLNDSKW